MSKINEPFLALPNRVIRQHAREWGSAGLLFYIMAESDRETHIIERWTDAAAAKELGIPLDTLRKQRKGLARAGLISSCANQHYQKIFVADSLFPIAENGGVASFGQSDGRVANFDKPKKTADLTQLGYPSISKNRKGRANALKPNKPARLRASETPHL